MPLPRILFACIAAAIVAQPVHAEPIADDAELGALYQPGGLTSDLAARRARESSPAVAHRIAELESAIIGVETAKLGRVPVISGKLSYTRLSPIEQGTIPIAAGAPGGLTLPVLLDSYVAQAQIVVPLSDYALRHPSTIKAAKLGAAVARSSTLAASNDAAATARRAYYEWIRARLSHVIAQRQLGQVEGNLARVREIFAAGRAPRADLLRLESQQAATEGEVDRLYTTSQLREEILRLQIGAPAGEPLAIGEDIRGLVAVPVWSPTGDLTERAIAKRPELRTIKQAIEAIDQRRIAERANQLPKLSAFATAEYSNPNQRVFPASDTFSGTWTAGLQISWTLNDALISRTQTRRLAADARALNADHEQARRDVRIAVLSAQQHVDNARRAIATTAKGLEAAEEGYRVRRALLAAERVTAVELVDAETDLARARIAALDARIDLRIAIADLEHATGNDR